MLASAPASSIPVLDLSPLLLPIEHRDAESVKRLAAQLDRACRDVGFFHITGWSGAAATAATAAAPRTLHQQRFPDYVRRFFALPQSSKDALDSSASPAAHGYNSLLHGRHNCTPEDGRQDTKVRCGVVRCGGTVWPGQHATPAAAA